ncbi:hypothetical protein [Arthrobacter psychrochitiniphilus]|uniref:hypothetical protein n=1 Tax=Arthrobacter psychrochitiniphilus TaxID=291045 RepID=UPI0011B4ED12|nr:hypothetical protein [Arthrobacter psychrochitiniphilus]
MQQKLVDRKTPRDGLVNSRDKIEQLAKVFLAGLEASDKASRTKDKYDYCVNKYILPALGEVRIGEATSGVIDRFIRGLVEDVGPSTARSCGAVLSWMFKVALRHDAVTSNPVRGITIPHGKKSKLKALDVEQYRDLRAKVIELGTGANPRPAPNAGTSRNDGLLHCHGRSPRRAFRGALGRS